MYAKIIVPLDGSSIAEGILPYARTFAKACNAPVELLHVITPEVIDVLSDPAHRRYADDVEVDMKRHGLSYLRPIAASLSAQAAECVVRVGEPAEVIAEEAKPGTLVIMATHGRSGVQRWLLGSVADKVLHTVRTHLLLARTGHYNNGKEAALKSVVVPLDGSALAEKILPWVAALAKMMGLEIVLIRAYSLPNAFYSTDEYVPKMWEFAERLKEEGRSYLESRVESLKSQGVKNVSSILVEGDGAAEIIDFARKTPENLIAMSTHGRSGIRRLLGSVTDRVVRNSWDPVLVMPPALALVESAGRKLDGIEDPMAAAGGSSRPIV
ncbi:MAG TPA: universal stress protein [Verrucomicrobiae bacterium]|nr:universal stress protein [Verrucomicrobiae bacterium]